MKLISACLLGIRCDWNGESRANTKILKLAQSVRLIPVCPEQLGGLPTPRSPQEIQGRSGEAVIDGVCRVFTVDGHDVTHQFIRGAEETLAIARLFGAREFIGKSCSPSCGCNQIYDGSFSGKIISGDGVTTALLKRNGITVTTEKEIR